MNPLSDELRTDQGPPMAIPLRHFVVSLGFLFVASITGVAMTAGSLPGLERVAYVHLLLLGWVCLTIMGAMTQFVPVWSGVPIYSRRLAVGQLWLVVVGLISFVLVLLAGRFEYLPLAAVPLLLGIWTFVYNVARTLARARPLDVTEGHFAAAITAFALLAPLGYLLAVDVANPIFDPFPVDRGSVYAAHVTLALFGAISLTVVGALYQLAKMFTGSSLTRYDRSLVRFESGTLPVGVFLLALGRGLEVSMVARLGAIAILLGLFAFAVVLTGLLVRATVDRSPMTDRYRIVAASIFLWIILTAPSWAFGPIDRAAVWGHPDSGSVLVLGVFAFVVVGTLYHVVPFIIWLERYSDRLGFEPVPMIDDLYSTRLERIDLSLLLIGTVGVVVSGFGSLPGWVVLGFSVLIAIAFVLFLTNMLVTIHRHGPDGLRGVFVSGGRAESVENDDVGLRERGDGSPPERVDVHELRDVDE